MIAGYQPGGWRKPDDEICAEGYKGKNEWWVTRGNTVLRVRAKSPQSAVKTALERWGLDWKRLENYSACSARKCKG